MSLRWKTNLIIIITAVVLVLAIFTIAQLTFTRDFQKLEAQRAVEMAERARNALSDRIQSLNTLSHDYAFWDDTCDFVCDPEVNQAYIRTNFTETTLTNCDLNFVFIIDTTGKIVYHRGFDLSDHTDLAIPDSLIQKLSTTGLSHHNNPDDGLSGILILPEMPLMLSSQPIVTSDGEGPVAGTMIMARFLDPEVLTDLGERVLLPVSIVPVENYPSLLPSSPESSLPATTTTTEIIDTKHIAGSTLIRDIEGQPALLLSVVVPRDIYDRGIITTHYFLISITILLLLATVLINLLLAKTVTARVNRVGTYIGDVAGKGELSKTLPVKGNDELAHISKDVNSLFQALEVSRLALKGKEKNEQELLRMMKTAVDGIIVTDLAGVITEINESKSQLLGYTDKKELLGKTVTDLVNPLQRTRFRNNLEETFITRKTTSDKVTMLKKDGSLYESEVHVVVLKEGDTTPVGFLISCVAVSTGNRTQSQERVQVNR